MNYHTNILSTIGNTPLVELHKVVAEVPAQVLMKVETFNPGHSIKDRMALKMVLDAEERGDLRPGGTIIECTSGNTGMGLAIAAAVKVQEHHASQGPPGRGSCQALHPPDP